jgi:hypothetical protein
MRMRRMGKPQRAEVGANAKAGNRPVPRLWLFDGMKGANLRLGHR